MIARNAKELANLYGIAVLAGGRGNALDSTAVVTDNVRAAPACSK
jgi:hypothetical protein